MLESQNAEPMIFEGKESPGAFLTGKSAMVFQKRFDQPIILLAHELTCVTNLCSPTVFASSSKTQHTIASNMPVTNTYLQLTKAAKCI
jgi:hypothetical protein